MQTTVNSSGECTIATLFALIYHSGEAEKVGMKMLPIKLLIFGSPKHGTPVLLAAPSIAIDLPLKVLVWEGTPGKIWISYDSPEYLVRRHGLTLHLTLTPQILPDVSSFNVIADWPGTENPEQIVIDSGHLDSWDLGTGSVTKSSGWGRQVFLRPATKRTQSSTEDLGPMRSSSDS